MADYISPSNLQTHAKEALSSFLNKVYAWMAIGLLLSAMSSYYVASNVYLQTLILQNKLIFFALILAQLGLVFGIGFLQNRLSATTARLMFLGYTLLTGVTLSTIFLVFTMQSIMSTFMITAVSFAGLSFYGMVTKRDLGPIGTFCIMGLWGMIIVMLAGIFIPALHNNTMQLTIAAIGVLVFSGLTAYDTQKIKVMYLQSQGVAANQAIFGALTLYLDFINLFLSLLRLMGDRK